jgi:DDE superfamily endonuclease
MLRAREMAYGLLSCTGRFTVTGFLIAIGKQFADWTAAYQLFQAKRMNIGLLFETSSKVCLEQLHPKQMIVVHMDDTIIRKAGKHIPGTSWKRDPLGPAFHTNLIWAQRFIQLSMSMHRPDFEGPSKAIPIDFHHCPGVKKPSKRATEEEVAGYKEAKKTQNLSQQGLDRIKCLRKRLDKQDAKDRTMLLSVDGSYTNATILKGLPRGVTLIGRIRKDAHLSYLPETMTTKGRSKVYGLDAPTPEELRQSDVAWQEVRAWAVGRWHNFNIKTIKSLRWRVAGQNQLLQMVVVSPLGYRLKNGGRLLYRKPAYLICTDNGLDVESLLQAYLYRWEIEVNFREEKTINGCGEAQVRNKVSAEKVPQFNVAMHAFLHLAEHVATKMKVLEPLPKAKWEKGGNHKRQSTNNVLNLFRGYLWYEKMGKSFSDFIHKKEGLTSTNNTINDALTPAFYIRR